MDARQLSLVPSLALNYLAANKKIRTGENQTSTAALCAAGALLRLQSGMRPVGGEYVGRL